MNIRLGLALIGTLYVLTCSPVVGATPELEFLERTESSVVGFSPSTKITFSSLLQSDGSIAVEFAIRQKSLAVTYNPSGSLIYLSVIKHGHPSQITRHDQKKLISLYQELQAMVWDETPIQHELLETLDALLVMLPLGQKIYYFDTTKHQYGPPAIPQTITEICSLRGKCGTGAFDIGFDNLTRTTIVGDPAHECYGRCGIGCDKNIPGRGLRPNGKNIYTQECLNHDACTDANNGLILGDCGEEFRAAYDSYKHGRNCDHLLVGRWNVQIGYRNRYFRNVKFTPEWLLYDDHTMLECEDGYPCLSGTWEVKSNSVFKADLGGGFAKFASSRISEDDLNMKNGAVSNEYYKNGSWSAQHSSIVPGEPLECGNGDD